MKIQFLKDVDFALNSCLPKKNVYAFDTIIKKTEKTETYGEHKKREEKENEWYLKKQLQSRFCSKFLESNCFQELTPYQVLRDKVPVTTRHRQQATGSQMKASEIKPRNWIAWL